MTLPADLARLIQDVLSELGWSAQPEAIAQDVRRLDIGLSLEDEFSVVCAWLGRCELLHKLDQLQVPPGSRTEFQVPDLLATFHTSKSPLLIEVKSHNENTLSFKPDYLRRLQKYAELLNLPLLIAWKWHGLWILFDVQHLKLADRNFNISYSTAMRENLLGALAGDVAYKIGAGAGIHLRMRKDRLIGKEQHPDGHTEEWLATFDDVAFSDYEGARRTELDPEVQALFFTWDLQEREEHTESHVYQHFVAGDEGILYAHMALVRLLGWELPADERPHWRRLLRSERVTKNVANFSLALDKALTEKIVSHVFHQRPQSLPRYLK